MICATSSRGTGAPSKLATSRAGAGRIETQSELMCLEGLPQCPPSCSCPGVAVHLHPLSKHIAAGLLKQRPGNGEVTSRIAYRRAPEVDDGAELPSRVRRFDGVMSPWTHTGGAVHVEASAASHAKVAAPPSMSSPNSSIAARVFASQVATGPPRKKLCRPAAGPSLASIARAR